MPVCTFVLLRLLSELFVSQDDEIKAVYGSFFRSYNSCDSSLWSPALWCCSRFACVSRWCPRCKAEGQVTPLDLMLAPLPWLIHTICGLSEHIYLLGNSFWAQSSPPFAFDTCMCFTRLVLFLFFAGLKFRFTAHMTFLLLLKISDFGKPKESSRISLDLFYHRLKHLTVIFSLNLRAFIKYYIFMPSLPPFLLCCVGRRRRRRRKHFRNLWGTTHRSPGFVLAMEIISC